MRAKKNNPMARKIRKRKSVKRTPQPRKRQNPFWQIFIRKRLVPSILFCCILVSGTWLYSSGAYGHFKDKAWQTLIEQSVAKGFVVKDVQVIGRKRISREKLIAILNTQKNDPIFSFKPLEAQIRLEQLSWIKTAYIKRRLPDTIVVTIVEREPTALWQHNQKLAVIDAEGIVLTDQNVGQFNHLPVLIGPTANQHVMDILPLLYAEQDVINEIKAITRIRDRRWDLILKNKAIVKLPEHDVGLALSQLAQMNRQEQIFKKDLSIIDLRLADQVIIRPTPRANLTIERPEIDDDKKTSKKNI